MSFKTEVIIANLIQKLIGKIQEEILLNAWKLDETMAKEQNASGFNQGQKQVVRFLEDDG